MRTREEIEAHAANACDIFQQAEAEVAKVLLNRQIMVISDFHDQPGGGTSRPNWLGKICSIAEIYVDPNVKARDDKSSIWVLLKGASTYIRLNKVTLL